jgi:hypothetical protein
MIWKKMVVFCVRVHLLSVEARTKLLCQPFSKSQQRATSKLWNDASTTLDAVVDAEINGSSWLEDMSDAATFRQTTTDPLTPYLGRDELSDDARSTTPAFDTQLDMFDDESFSVRSDNSDDDTDEDYVQASSIA